VTDDEHLRRELAASPRRVLDEVTSIVSQASAAILTFAPATAARRVKPDRSLVSAADEAAESLIGTALARLMPGVPIISEEAPAAHAPPGKHFILVDPLDGTREFLAGSDEFTVNVAILVDGAPVLGVVAAPALGQVWRGIIGTGAERLDLAPGAAPAQARAVTAVTPRHGSTRLVAALSRSHLDERTAAFVAGLPRIERLICGSSLKFCRLAEGSADLYPRLAPVREWDIAAGHAVLAASGGTVTAPDGAALTYGRATEGFLVPGFVAWGGPALAGQFGVSASR